MVNIFKECQWVSMSGKGVSKVKSNEQWGQSVHNRMPDHISLADYDKDLCFYPEGFMCRVT